MNITFLIETKRFTELLKIDEILLDDLDDRVLIKLYRCKNNDVIKHIIDCDINKKLCGQSSCRVIDIALNFADKCIIDYLMNY